MHYVLLFIKTKILLAFSYNDTVSAALEKRRRFPSAPFGLAEEALEGTGGVGRGRAIGDGRRQRSSEGFRKGGGGLAARRRGWRGAADGVKGERYDGQRLGRWWWRRLGYCGEWL